MAAASVPPPLTHGTSATQRGEHAVALRVMRLLRPELVIDDELYMEDGDVACDAVRAEERRSWGAGEVVGSELRLPSSIGQLHDGESFRICVSIHNVASTQVQNVALRVELSTATKRIPLLAPDAKNSHALIPAFHPSGHRDFILDYPLQEEGQHTLMCNVTYTDEREPRTFRKVFKFHVGRTVKIRDVKIWTISDFVMVSVELQNTSKAPLLVQSNFTASAGYQLLEVPKEDDEVWLRAMAVDEVRRSLFRLIPNRDTGSRGVGRLEITWQGRMGEGGRLESTDIQHRSNSEKPAIEVTHLHIPNTVKIHTPFKLHATLMNTSPERVPLSPYLILSADKMHPLSFTGPSQYFMGTIDHGKSLKVHVNMVALSAGVHEVTGIEVCDAHTGKPLMQPLTNTFVAAVR